MALGEAVVKIVPDTTGFSATLKKDIDAALKGVDDTVKKTTDGIEDKFKETGKESEQAVKGIGDEFKKLGKLVAGAAIGRALFGFAKDAIAAAEAAQVSRNRIQQVAKSMDLFGDEVGKVTDRLVEYAEQTARQTGIDDDQIQLTQAKLLTFKNLAITAGEMGGAFDRATKAAIDMGAAGFGDAAGNAVQLGKALQDPIKGITALNRSGITFTADQKELIKTLVETNRVAEAQEIILSAIEQQVGGTAEATATGSAKMRIAFEELQEEVGTALAPAFESITRALIPIFDAFAALPQDLQTIIVAATLAGGAFLALSSSLQGVGVSAKNANLFLGKVGLGLAAFGAVVSIFSKTMNLEADEAFDGLTEAIKENDKTLRNAAILKLAEESPTIMQYLDLWGQFGITIDDLSQYLRTGEGPALEFADALQDMSLASGDLEDKIARINEGFGTNFDVTKMSREEMELIVAAAGDLQFQIFELGQANLTTSNATDALGSALGETREEAELATQSFKDQEDALNGLLEATLAQFNSEIQFQRSMRQTSDAILEYNALVLSMENGTYEGSDAFRDLAESSEEVYLSSLAQAQGMVDLAVDTATAAGEFVSAEEKNRLMRDELNRIAATLDPNSPLRRQLLGYVTQLESIPTDVSTTVQTTYLTIEERRLINADRTPAPAPAPAPTGTLADIDFSDPFWAGLGFADGGIFDQPQIGLFAEAGAEAIIPLTRPARALELMRDSGLLGLAQSASPASGQNFDITVVSAEPMRTAKDVVREFQALEYRMAPL